MAQGWFDPDRAAQELLERFGAQAVGRGGPLAILLRPDGHAGIECREVEASIGLLGYRVAEEWSAVGLVATGRFRRLDPAAEMPAPMVPGLFGGLKMACVVTRGDEIGWYLELPDGTPWKGAPEQGFMLDVLRRSLGLPTGPERGCRAGGSAR